MKRLLVGSLVALAFSSISAHAAVFNIGNITLQQQVPTTQINIAGDSSFSDTYNFTLLSDALFTSSVIGIGVSFDTDLFFGLTNLNIVNALSLININPFITSLDFGPLSGPLSLASGNYSFVVLGNTGEGVGAYAGSFTLGHPAPVAAVPEAETTAMFLAGLGLLGVVSRRRKQS